MVPRLKTFELGVRQLTTAYQHLAVLGAALEGRDHLSRVQEALRVEGGFDGEHQRVLFTAELHAHRIQLLDTHAMLTCHGTSHGNACFENVGTK